MPLKPPPTFKQVLSEIKTFAERHYQVHDFRYGDPDQFFANGDLKYVALCCDALPPIVDAEYMRITFMFDVWLFDQANVATKSRASEVDVVSDLIQISQDFISHFKKPSFQNDFTTQNITNIQPNFSTGEDRTISVNFVAAFEVDFIPNGCIAPLTPEEIGSFNNDFNDDFKI